MRTAPILVASSVWLASLLPNPAAAAWPALGRAVCLDPNPQRSARVATDGAAGAIVVWQDLRSNKVNVFARHVLANGELDPAWPVDGRALLADSTALAGAAGGQTLPVVAPDGAGGAIVAWNDGRSAVTGNDIYAQHVLASGALDPAWPVNGRVLCSAPGPQGFARIIADGAAGAIVTWIDGRSAATDADIYAQRVSGAGIVAWLVDGVAVTTALEPQAFPQLVSDGLGGAIVAWEDFSTRPSGIDLFAQHVIGAGIVDPAWPSGGRALSLALDEQEDHVIATDGANGAIVAWQDSRDGTGDIYAQRVLATGGIAPGWPSGGRAVCTAVINQSDPAIAPDGTGGAIIAWTDFRNGVNHSLFAHHLLASSALDAGWPADGREIAPSLANAEQTGHQIVGDGAGGAIIAWEEQSFLRAHHIEATGLPDPSFPSDGRRLRNAPSVQLSADLVASGKGNAIVAWHDGPTAQATDIFAQLVTTLETTDVEPGTPADAVTFAPPRPNPSASTVTLRYALPRRATVSLAIYDAAGRRVRALAVGTQSEGEHVAFWDLRNESGRKAAVGIYFARLEVEDHVFSQKFLKVQ